MNARKLKVMVVDDSDDDIVLLTEALREELGIELLHAAHNGDAALAYLRREGAWAGADRPGLLLLDINMPGKTGFDVLSALKQDHDLSDIPVVMLSTSALETDRNRALACGAASYVTKPSNFDALRSTVRCLVEHWSRPDAGSTR